MLKFINNIWLAKCWFTLLKWMWPFGLEAMMATNAWATKHLGKGRLGNTPFEDTRMTDRCKV